MRASQSQEIAVLKQGGAILAAVLQATADVVEPGITTRELDAYAEKSVIAKGAKPSFKGYEGFPATLCTSVNDCIVHGIPGDYTLKEGDVIGLDCGVWYEGFCTDMAITVGVGRIAKPIELLIAATKESLAVGLKQIRAGATTGDYGAAVQDFLEQRDYGVIRNLVGHGVGRAVHEEPRVPNFGRPHSGTELVTGLVLALEPMTSLGTYEIETLSDGWGIRVLDGSATAHFELTVMVTEKGFEYITPVIW